MKNHEERKQKISFRLYILILLGIIIVILGYLFLSRSSVKALQSSSQSTIQTSTVLPSAGIQSIFEPVTTTAANPNNMEKNLQNASSSLREIAQILD